MDKYGYPEEGELEKIKNWKYDDFSNLMKFVEVVGLSSCHCAICAICAINVQLIQVRISRSYNV